MRQADATNVLELLRDQLAALMQGQRQEAALAVVLDQMPIGVMIADAPSGAIVFQNRASEGLIGEVRDDIDSVDKYNAFGAIHADGAPLRASEYPLVRVLAGEGPIKDQIVLYKRPDRSVVSLRVDADIVRDAAGTVIAAVATFLDVTAERAAEAARVDTEARLRSALEATTDGVLVLDGAMRVLFRNDSARAMLGDASFGLDATPPEATPDAVMSPFLKAYRTARETGRPAEAEEFYAPLARTFRARAFPSGGLVTVFFQDVSEQAAIERMRRDLTGELAHRIANIFTLVIGMIKLSARVSTSAPEMAAALGARVTALAAAHALVRPMVDDDRTPSTTLDAVISKILAPHVVAGCDRVTVDAPSAPIGPNATTALAMVLHELATNSAKYGALRDEAGALRIAARLADDALRLEWVERVSAPKAASGPGFGQSLIDSSVRLRLRGRIEREWREEGLAVTITAPASALAR